MNLPLIIHYQQAILPKAQQQKLLIIWIWNGLKPQKEFSEKKQEAEQISPSNSSEKDNA
jgi:hypothetical protein